MTKKAYSEAIEFVVVLRNQKAIIARVLLINY